MLRRVLLFCTAFVLVVFSAGCEKRELGMMSATEGNEQTGTEVQSGEVGTRGILVCASKVLYPQELDRLFLESELYQDAVRQQAVILGEDQPVTDSEGIKSFMQAVEDKKSARLKVYYMFGQDEETGQITCSAKIFDTAGGIVAMQSFWDIRQIPSSMGEEDAMADAGIQNVFYLTDYGRLVFAPDETFEPSSLHVIHDSEFDPDFEVHQSLYDTYILPILADIGHSEWSIDAPQSIRWLWMFEDICWVQGRDPAAEYGNTWPVQEMYDTLSCYFDVSYDALVRQLSSDVHLEYHAEDQTIFIREGAEAGLSATV